MLRSKHVCPSMRSTTARRIVPKTCADSVVARARAILDINLTSIRSLGAAAILRNTARNIRDCCCRDANPSSQRGDRRTILSTAFSVDVRSSFPFSSSSPSSFDSWWRKQSNRVMSVLQGSRLLVDVITSERERSAADRVRASRLHINLQSCGTTSAG